MRWRFLVPTMALVVLAGCSEGILEDEEDAGPGDQDTTADTGVADTAESDTASPDTGQPDTTPDDPDGGPDPDAGDTGDTGDTGSGNDAGLQLEGQLTPLGHYSMGGSYQMNGHLVPGPESGRQLKGGKLTVEPVKLETK